LRKVDTPSNFEAPRLSLKASYILRTLSLSGGAQPELPQPPKAASTRFTSSS